MLTKQSIQLPITFESNLQTGTTAAYIKQGKGPTLLMLHGFMGDATCWQPLIEKLRNHFCCISLDLLGFGDSEKPKIRYDIASQVAFVQKFIEKQNINSIYIIGHSFGAWVASAYTIKYPQLVKGLILAGPAGIRDDSFCGRYDALRPLLWETPLIDIALNLAKPFAKVAGKSQELETIGGFRKSLMTQPVARSFLMSRLRPEDAIDTVENHIHQITCPTLVIAGENDDTIPLWHSQTYKEKISNSKLLVIPQASHALPQQYAGEMTNAILEFMSPSLKNT